MVNKQYNKFFVSKVDVSQWKQKQSQKKLTNANKAKENKKKLKQKRKEKNKKKKKKLMETFQNQCDNHNYADRLENYLGFSKESVNILKENGLANSMTLKYLHPDRIAAVKELANLTMGQECALRRLVVKLQQDETDISTATSQTTSSTLPSQNFTQQSNLNIIHERNLIESAPIKTTTVMNVDNLISNNLNEFRHVDSMPVPLDYLILDYLHS